MQTHFSPFQNSFFLGQFGTHFCRGMSASKGHSPELSHLWLVVPEGAWLKLASQTAFAFELVAWDALALVRVVGSRNGEGWAVDDAFLQASQVEVSSLRLTAQAVLIPCRLRRALDHVGTCTSR